MKEWQGCHYADELENCTHYARFPTHEILVMNIPRESLHVSGYGIEFGTAQEDCENSSPNNNRNHLLQIKQARFQEKEDRNSDHGRETTHEAYINSS